jgi:glutathione S-transferase
MAFTYYYHPLASFCWKPLIAVYEAGVPIDLVVVNLGDPRDRADFLAVWPLGKFPVLVDSTSRETVPESTIIIEYLAERLPEAAKLLPQNATLRREARLLDRIFDHDVQEPMQKIVGDRIRPQGRRDPFGVAQAHEDIRTAYLMLETRLEGRPWAAGEAFSLADCAAAPALFYADKVEPLGAHAGLAAYLERLLARPSFARVIEEARPYFHLFPEKPASR